MYLVFNLINFQNGRQLYDNYLAAKKFMECITTQPVKVDIPQINASATMNYDRFSTISAQRNGHQDPPSFLNLNREIIPERVNKISPCANSTSDACCSNHSSIVFDQVLIYRSILNLQGKAKTVI